MTEYEFTQFACDAWQVQHLANNWQADYGWEVVSVFNAHPQQQIYKKIGDESSELVNAVSPVTVLFRRPLKDEDES